MKKIVRTALLLTIVTVLGASSTHAQTENAQSKASLAKELNSALLMHPDTKPVSHITNKIQEFLTVKPRALGNTPHLNFATEMQQAKLPSKSVRVYQSIDITKNGLLSSTRTALLPLEQSNLPSIDVKKLRDGGHVNPANLK